MNIWSQIRKFGLEYCDLPTMLWNVSVFLRFLTLNIYGKKKIGVPWFFYVVIIVGLLCYFYVYLVSVLWYVFVKYPETRDMVAVTVVLSVGVASEIGILKLLYMFLYIEKIQRLTDAFLEFDASIHTGSKRANNVLKYMRNVKIRAIFYWVVVMGNGTMYNLIPFARPGRHFADDLLILYGLEPMFESPNYEIAWIVTVISIFIICYISSNVTTYLVVIIGYAESQFLLLSEDVNHIWSDAEAHHEALAQFESDNFVTNYDRKHRIMNDYVHKNMKNIIKRHAAIKTLLNQAEEVFRVPIAAGLTLLIIGIITELLGGLENTILQLPFTFIQVGVDCFVGQRVMDAGVVFEQALYDCKWENFDKDNMKMVLVMMQASQRPTAVSAGGITMVSFRSLMAATRATYSAYTALRSVMKKE